MGYQVQEVWKQLEYIITVGWVFFLMDDSLRGHDILLADLHGTKTLLLRT